MIQRTFVLLISVLFFFQLPAHSQEEAERKLDEFHTIQIAGQITAFLIPGDEYKIHIEAEDIEVEKITTKVEDKTLTVKLLTHLFKDPTVYVKITYKDLQELNALADAEVNFQKPLIQSNFKIKSTSGANIELQIDARNLKLEAFQGGQVVIKGETDSLDAYVNTGGVLSGSDLV